MLFIFLDIYPIIFTTLFPFKLNDKENLLKKLYISSLNLTSRTKAPPRPRANQSTPLRVTSSSSAPNCNVISLRILSCAIHFFSSDYKFKLFEYLLLFEPHFRFHIQSCPSIFIMEWMFCKYSYKNSTSSMFILYIFLWFSPS